MSPIKVDDSMPTISPLQFSTRAIHVGNSPSAETGAVIPPLSLSTTFEQESVGVHKGFEYSRSQNPTRLQLETSLASLEGGAGALAFASGSAATAAAVMSLGVNAHILSVNDVYGGTARYLTRVGQATQGLKTTFIDLETSSDEDIYNSIQENTKLIWIESPTNPTLRLISVPKLVKIAASHPSKPLVLVDNTFLSPYFSNPIAQGADIVLHSISKYINGHSDVIMGALIVRKGREETLEGLRFLQNASGAIPSPFDCYLTLRGIKTLALRALQHGLSALRIANFLSTHPLVESVTYPGLVSHPSHDLAKSALAPQVWRDLKKIGWNEAVGVPFGGMVSFKIRGGGEEADQFLQASHLFCLAESLGGVESLAEVPDKMTHAGIPEEARLALGITPNLIRLSVGVEDTEDLVADIDQAIRRAVSVASA
ncbi:Cys/Met metabolism PLP-dependent enzyme-domain-containing protein [Mrakia frigida]|uniref:trans-sulfuration enzyme family protein n=1 Tax=Mrakia frigida TaxID=29902 RepID=UPI003FCC0494